MNKTVKQIKEQETLFQPLEKLMVEYFQLDRDLKKKYLIKSRGKVKNYTPPHLETLLQMLRAEIDDRITILEVKDE